MDDVVKCTGKARTDDMMITSSNEPSWDCDRIPAFSVNYVAVYEKQDAYVNPKTCFLNYKNGMIWAFAGPAAVVIFINLTVLCEVVWIIYRSSHSSKRFVTTNKTASISESLKRATRGALLLMPILSIPWIVGFLYNLYANSSPAGVVVGTTAAYLQSILVGIQGILVFLFYCFHSTEVRNAYELSARRRKSEGEVATYSTTRKRSRIPLLFTREICESGRASRQNSFRQVRSHSQDTVQSRPSIAPTAQQNSSLEGGSTFAGSVSTDEKHKRTAL